MFKTFTERGALSEFFGSVQKFDPIKFYELLDSKVPGLAMVPGSERLRLRLLGLMLNFGIPFNRWLGMRIEMISPEQVMIGSPPSVLRKNHVGTAHACAQALIGEYTAGLVVAQHFRATEHRVIIGRLEIDYQKAGRGFLRGVARAPAEWPELKDGQAWVKMQTEITNSKGEVVSVCKTQWQVKTWDQIKLDREARAGDPAIGNSVPTS